MIWLILRVLAFILVLGGIAWLGDWLLSADGEAQLVWNGREYPALSPLEIVLAVLIVMVALWVVFKLLGLALAILRFALGDETAFSRWRSRARERRGVDEVAKAQLALAAGEAGRAQSHARRATRLLGERDLTQILNAQVAEANGDDRRAREEYRALAREPATALAGVKGLLNQAVARGETARAAKLAGAAHEMRPGDAQVQQSLFDLQTRAADWPGARKTLEAMRKSKTLPRDVVARRGAVLDLEMARAAEEPATQRSLAEGAAKAAPDLAPAAILAANRQTADGDLSRAEKTLKESWRWAPQPDIARAFAEIAPNETPQERRKRFQGLLRANLGHEETRLTAAELAVAEGVYEDARAELGDLPSEKPSHRALALMAAVEKAQGAEEHVVRGWLARAVTAPRGAHWICEKCGAAPAEWSAVCPSCGSFDTLMWKEPDTPDESLGSAMLPLIAEDDEEHRLDDEAAEEAVRESR